MWYEREGKGREGYEWMMWGTEWGREVIQTVEMPGYLTYMSPFPTQFATVRSSLDTLWLPQRGAAADSPTRSTKSQDPESRPHLSHEHFTPLLFLRTAMMRSWGTAALHFTRHCLHPLKNTFLNITLAKDANSFLSSKVIIYNALPSSTLWIDKDAAWSERAHVRARNFSGVWCPTLLQQLQ